VLEVARSSRLSIPKHRRSKYIHICGTPLMLFRRGREHANTRHPIRPWTRNAARCVSPSSCRAADLVTARATLRLQIQMQIHTACGTDGRLRLDCIASHRAPPFYVLNRDLQRLQAVGGRREALPPSSLLPSTTQVRFPTSSPFASLHACRRPQRYIGAGYTGGALVRLRSCAVSFKSELVECRSRTITSASLEPSGMQWRVRMQGPIPKRALRSM
jgi:hypothetical protein